MDDEQLTQLATQLADRRAGERLRALDAITAKSGRAIVRLVEDDRAVALLTEALGDSDLRVRRAAARGLRPWVRERPELLDDVLPRYTASSFDGSYTHLGLYDTQTGDIHIPRFAALKGHAALLKDGNTDRYFKFEFYIPGQAPSRFVDARMPASDEGHLVLQYILDWSYARQQLIPEFDERRRGSALAEQDRYAAAVVRFYEDCRLPYDVCVHHLTMTTGRRARLERDMARIAGRS